MRIKPKTRSARVTRVSAAASAVLVALALGSPALASPPSNTDDPGSSSTEQSNTVGQGLGDEVSVSPERDAENLGDLDVSGSSESSDASETPVALASSAHAKPFPRWTTRLGGANRYDTSAKVAARFSPGVPAVFIATGLDFPDALSAAASAAKSDGPVLLTAPQKLSAEVTAQLKRLSPGKVFVIGGTGAVSDAVLAQAKAATGKTPVRIGGANRYETSLNLSKQVFPSAKFAVIATGNDFPDALSASPVAGLKSGPTLLVNGKKTAAPQALIAELRRLGVSQVLIAGGKGAVSTGVESSLKAAGFSVIRKGGGNRYQTANLVNAAYFPGGSSSDYFLATGTQYPDALSGAALAGAIGAPVFITTPSCVPTSVRAGISALNPTAEIVLGGTGAVTPNAANLGDCANGSWRPTIPKKTTQYPGRPDCWVGYEQESKKVSFWWTGCVTGSGVAIPATSGCTDSAGHSWSKWPWQSCQDTGPDNRPTKTS